MSRRSKPTSSSSANLVTIIINKNGLELPGNQSKKEKTVCKKLCFVLRRKKY